MFRWSSPLSSRLAIPQGSERLARTESSPAPERRSFWKKFSGIFITEAWAHLPPLTGEVTILSVSLPGRACDFQVLTTEKDWTPTAELNDLLTANRGSSFRVKLSNAYLESNRITEGPFRNPATIQFQLAP